MYNNKDKFSPDPKSPNYPCYYELGLDQSRLNPLDELSPGYHFNNPFIPILGGDLCKTGMTSCSQLNDATNPK